MYSNLCINLQYFQRLSKGLVVQLVAFSLGFNPHLRNFYQIVHFVKSLSMPTLYGKHNNNAYIDM